MSRVIGQNLARRNGLAVLASLAVVVMACSSGATPSTTPSATPSATLGGPGPTVGSEATIAPTASPLPGLELVWETGGPRGSTGDDQATYSPAVDPLTGDVWAASSFDSVIWIFGADGKFKETFGSPGDGEGEFNFVRPTCRCGAGALAFAPDGTLYVADVGNQRVQKFDPSHEFVTQWGSFGAGDGQFADATQIATDGTSVYVTDDARQDLQVFDSKGTFLRYVRPGGWLAVNSSGQLFVSAADRIVQYDPSGKEIAAFDLPNHPGTDAIGLAAVGEGRLFFNLQRQVAPFVGEALGELDLATGTVRLWADGGETIAGDPADGAIYAANFVNPAWPSATIRKYAIPAR